uniref:Uncharacterized protein n=1 Tax=viral metagenome TaxID=1070528 RepID=A0A2V0RM78_9ZZZZ
MSEYSAKSVLDKGTIPPVDSNDVLGGSFGAHIDQYLNKQPFDGPDGYVFRKISYRAATKNTGLADAGGTMATTAGEVLMTFKMDELCRGMIDATSFTGSTANDRTTTYINDDQDQESNNLENAVTITNEAKLQRGDIPLGAILVLEDARSTDNQNGSVFAGMVPVDNNDHKFSTDNSSKYGVFPSATSGVPHIISQSISKHYIGGAAKTKRLAVASRAFNTAIPVRFTDETAGKVVDSAFSATFGGDISTPVHCIGLSGITLDDCDNIFGNLHIYALCGPRTTGLSQPEIDYNFSVKECLKLGASSGHVHYET